MKTTRTAAIVLAAALTAMAACAPSPPGAVYVRVAPPPVQTEFMGAAPGPGFVWVRGYHRWDGTAYSWVPGTWTRAPRLRAVWVPGHWKHARRGWYWVDGRWK